MAWVTKREKREADMRRNPAEMRFDDLDAVLRGYNFVRRNEASSHSTYRHPSLSKYVNIPVHEGKVKRTYVLQAIAAIDDLKAHST